MLISHLKLLGVRESKSWAAVFIELVLGIGQVPRDSQLLAACVSHDSGWRVQCVF